MHIVSNTSPLSNLAVIGRLDIDELKGRSVARSFGLLIGGLLGELLHARMNGRVPSLATKIKRLRDEAGFFIGSDIEQFILSQAGE